jgi:hypothetical protein
MSQSGTWKALAITAALLTFQGIAFTNAEAASTTIVAQNSSKCLDVRGGPQATGNGALIEQYTCTGSSNQSWTLTDVGNQQYELIASNSNKCAESINGTSSSGNGTGIQQATCTGAPNQLWQLLYISSNVYRIVNVPNGKCLDVTGGPQAIADDVLTELWQCTGASNQSWALTAPQVTPRPLVAKNSGKCLDVYGGPQATQNGALIDQYTCTGAANQQWTLRTVVGGIELVAKNSGKCIEPVGGGTTNGTNIEQSDCTGVPQQLWTQQNQVGGAAGEYKFVHVPSGLCLDVTGGPYPTGNSVLMELYTCTGTTNQTWTIGTGGNVLPGTRDPLKWPFAQDSIWNMPIGSAAVYVPANLPALPDDPYDKDRNGNPIDSSWSAVPGIDWERIILKPTAPMTQIVYSSAGWSGANRCAATSGTSSTLPITVPIPTNYVQPNDNGNDGAVFLMPDGHTLMQTQPFTRCTAGQPGTSYLSFPAVDLYGDGRTGAHGGSKLSSFGGSIRLGELRPGQQGMRHALKVSLFKQMDYYNCSTVSECFRWPASTADSHAVDNYGSYNDNQNRAMKMGALLALPASVNINSLGLESEPGRQIAWTLQNYGAYIVDSYGAAVFGLNAEAGADGNKGDEFLADYGYALESRPRYNTPWTRDLQKIIPLLAVVDNNSATSIGGGGTPRQPLAPPFQ